MEVQKYILMLDKRGWRTLSRQNLGLDTEYMRIRSDLPEVDVPKGTVVIVDKDCTSEVSVTVICLDFFEGLENQFEQLKLVCIKKELQLLDESTYLILKPLSPSDRYQMMTDKKKFSIVGSKIGDSVWYETPSGKKSVGIIRYIGPVDGIENDATWFGVELIDKTAGSCDGTLGQKRYFECEPFTAIFTSAEKLTIYDEQGDLDQMQARIKNVVQTISSKSVESDGRRRLLIPDQTKMISTSNNNNNNRASDKNDHPSSTRHNNNNNNKHEQSKFYQNKDRSNGHRGHDMRRDHSSGRQNTDRLKSLAGHQSLDRRDLSAGQQNSLGSHSLDRREQSSGHQNSNQIAYSVNNHSLDRREHSNGHQNSNWVEYFAAKYSVDRQSNNQGHGSVDNRSLDRRGQHDIGTDGHQRVETPVSVERTSPVSDPEAWPSLEEAKPGHYDRASRVQQLLKRNTEPVQPPCTDSNSEIRVPGPKWSRVVASNSGSNLIDLKLAVGDRIVWLNDDCPPQYGTVKWIGYMPGKNKKQMTIGAEMDYAVGQGTGMFNGQRYFSTKLDYAIFLPAEELIRADDFENQNNDAQVQHQEPNRKEARPSPPSLASRLRATVEPNGGSGLNGGVHAVDELELKRLTPMSPMAQFKRSRNIHQMQNGEQRNVASLRNRFEGSGSGSSPLPSSFELDPSGSSRNRSSVSSSPGFQKRSPKGSPKQVSGYSHPDDVVERSMKDGNSGSYRPALAETSYKPGHRERDPYAPEHFVVSAEVHRRSPTPPPYGRSVSNSPSDDFNQESEQILPEFDRLHDGSKVSQVEIGTLVELHIKKDPFYGVLKWTGFLPPDHRSKMAGIEMEEELHFAGNGWHNGTQLFGCPPNKGVFVPYSHFQLDQRFEHVQPMSYSQVAMSKDLSGVPELKSPFGNVDCPMVPGSVPPIPCKEMTLLCGRNKGIQGHQNSCYLDATLFAMFSFTCVFDCLLFRPASSEDMSEYSEVQRVLRDEIVNPLRKNFFVRADRVMKLRQLLNTHTSVKGLTSEEKDPEEFLNSLLSQTLRASPFLELSSGQTSHLYQLFVERDESKWMPTVQDLVEQSFLTSGVKLRKVPSVLILQMPRFGKQFKVYDRILPSLVLDVTDIIEDSPRQCIVCGKLATLECAECFGEHGSGLDSTVFCEACFTRIHNHQKRQRHKWVKLKIPEEFHAQRFGNDWSNRRLFMELFAVVCIETSHYVSFVKSGLGPDAPWCFFDSMADRKGEQHGYNIPEVKPAPHVSNWLTEDGITFLNSCKDEKLLPDQAKRLVCDAYMCFYQSSEVMMYQ